MRLQKYLANMGIDSRRKCEEHIKAGRVMVNGKVIKEMGYSIDPQIDMVSFDGKKVKDSVRKVYIMLNKPKSYVTTVKDNFNRKTVIDLIDVKERVYPVGRLDYDTEGLLLLTNDGEFAYSLTHPKHRISKTYLAKIKGKPKREDILRFESGLLIDDYRTSKATFKLVKEYRENSLARITIWEGRNRQIRKMCEKIGHPVLSLKRVAIGPLELGDLQTGSFRYLTEDEVRYIGV